MVKNYFVAIYLDDGSFFSPFMLPCSRFPHLSGNDIRTLERPFTRSEIRKAVFDMGAFKSPRPDGFQTLFYQRNWDLVENKLLQLVLNVFEGRNLPDGLNYTFLVLIPKIENP